MNFRIFWGSDLCNCLCSTPTSLDQASAGFTFASACFCICTQQTYRVFRAAGVRIQKAGCLAFSLGFSLFPKCFVCISSLQDPERHFFVQLSYFSPQVQRDFFSLTTSLCIADFPVSVCSFGLYMRNEKLGLKICHNMSEELFTKSYTCFQTICSQ